MEHCCAGGVCRSGVGELKGGGNYIIRASKRFQQLAMYHFLLLASFSFILGSL